MVEGKTSHDPHEMTRMALRHGTILRWTVHLETKLEIDEHRPGLQNDGMNDFNGEFGARAVVMLDDLAPHLKSLHVKIEPSGGRLSSLRRLQGCYDLRRFSSSQETWTVKEKETRDTIAKVVRAMQQLKVKLKDVSFQAGHHSQRPIDATSKDSNEIATTILVSGPDSGVVWRV